jgi:uncharacterized GH25 family protein
MNKWIVATAIFLASASAVSFAAERAIVTGKVTDAAGKPLEHATVMVYHAGVKKGYSIFCPSCYTDCGKRTLTDANGAFTIDGLNPDLWFELLVVRDGYTPAFIEKVDPLKGPAATAALAVLTPVDDPSRMVLGRVVDAHGTPVRDAVVTPDGILIVRRGGTIYGTFRGLVAVTNERGEFEIAYSEPAVKMLLMVEPRAMAPKSVILPTGSERQTVTVSDGALVRGRLVDNGKPVGGAEIGLSPRQAWSGGPNLAISGSFYHEVPIGTQEDGTFAITNVPAPEEWNVYGKMESIASRGATALVALATTHDNQEVNVGDIQIKRGYRLRGKVLLSDGKPLPEGMRLRVQSEPTRDDQTILLSADGKFEFVGLAAGKYLFFPSVQGYRSPKDKPKIDASIDRDVDDLVITLDPVAAASTQR